MVPNLDFVNLIFHLRFGDSVNLNSMAVSYLIRYKGQDEQICFLSTFMWVELLRGTIEVTLSVLWAEVSECQLWSDNGLSETSYQGTEAHLGCLLALGCSKHYLWLSFLV